MISAAWPGVLPTGMPAASSAFFLSWAVPLPPETMRGVAHLLAFGGGETGDVGDNRLGHVLLGPCGGVLFGEAADFADHHDSLGVGVGFECLQGFQQRRADDRVAAGARHAVKPISDNSPMSW